MEQQELARKQQEQQMKAMLEAQQQMMQGTICFTSCLCHRYTRDYYCFRICFFYKLNKMLHTCIVHLYVHVLPTVLFFVASYFGSPMQRMNGFPPCAAGFKLLYIYMWNRGKNVSPCGVVIVPHKERDT